VFFVFMNRPFMVSGVVFVSMRTYVAYEAGVRIRVM
jgi:hypothetical protein